jgi:outer membrane protein OmpA-like peptidoglycan-associated protein
VIVFDMDKTELTAASKETLKAAVLASNRYPSEMLLVRGHASTHESDPAKLSHDRALRVAGFMINNDDADPRRMSITSTADLADSPTVELILGQELVPKSNATKQAHKVN